MLPEPARGAYRQALDAFPRTGMPAAARAASLERFLAAGFPAKREEEWRYTDLSGLSETVFAPASTAPAPDLAAHALPETYRVVFVNGRLDPGASQFPADAVVPGPAAAEPAAQSDAIVELNAALASDGVTLRLGAGRALDRPLHVLSLTVPGPAPAMSHLSHRIELARDASACVIFQDLTLGPGRHFLTQRVWLRVDDGARLELVRVQDHGEQVQALTRWDAAIGRDAQLDWMNLDLGGELVRNDLCASLAAANAGLALSGVFIASGRTHVDNHTRIDHRQPHGTSRQVWRGIATDRARGVFNGKVVVHPQAVKTDSDLQAANLLLSPQAEISAKPELQIDNDDVKCAHGATCGQLDAQALYYLRSRGLPLAAAREVLVYGFANAVVGQLRTPAARQLLRRRLIARLPSGAAVEEPA